MRVDVNGVGIDFDALATCSRISMPGCTRHRNEYVPTGASIFTKKDGSADGSEN